MGNKGSFVFYTEYREHLSMLPLEQVGELMIALIDYQETGEVPDLPKGSALAMCFSFIKARMDKDNSKYEEKCERNRSNGKKGGRPTKETEISETEENPNKPNGFSENRTVISETEENPNKPKKADNDNEYDNEYEYVNDNDITTTASSNNIYEYIEQNFGRTLSPIEYESISEWEDNELTRYAIKKAITSNKCSIGYITGILQNFKRNNITTVQQAQDSEEQYKQQKEQHKNTKG